MVLLKAFYPLLAIAKSALPPRTTCQLLLWEFYVEIPRRIAVLRVDYH